MANCTNFLGFSQYYRLIGDPQFQINWKVSSSYLLHSTSQKWKCLKISEVKEQGSAVRAENRLLRQ